MIITILVLVYEYYHMNTTAKTYSKTVSIHILISDYSVFHLILSSVPDPNLSHKIKKHRQECQSRPSRVDVEPVVLLLVPRGFVVRQQDLSEGSFVRLGQVDKYLHGYILRYTPKRCYIFASLDGKYQL